GREMVKCEMVRLNEEMREKRTFPERGEIAIFFHARMGVTNCNQCASIERSVYKVVFERGERHEIRGTSELSKGDGYLCVRRDV
ncbi:hypothetical protein, partial [Alicyclobacillus sp. SP_1]|uniref:hypothetical protein n=1 Tax=Alicyclobacillus sp. SP_1 TaxID=2942475 RepID=UPI002157F54C